MPDYAGWSAEDHLNEAENQLSLWDEEQRERKEEGIRAVYTITPFPLQLAELHLRFAEVKRQWGPMR